MIPHFEKMLYDNIQYIILLTHFLKFKKSDYLLEKLRQTISFINSEFKSEDNLIGSAMDADSEGVEGKYYTWAYEDLKIKLGDKFEIFKKGFDISVDGNFDNLNILSEKNIISLTNEERKNFDAAKKFYESIGKKE